MAGGDVDELDDERHAPPGPGAEDPGPVGVARGGAVATVTLRNPGRMNAMSEAMVAGLAETFEDLGADPEVRAIVLTGEGRAFSSGLDLEVLREPYERGEVLDLRDRQERGYNRMVRAIALAQKPVIAAVNGPAAGAGMALALACDLRLAAESAVFMMAFVRIGLVPDSGASYFLPRIVGVGRAAELALTGEPVGAARALELGLVNRVVPDAELSAQTARLAADLAAMPTVALGLTKRLLLAGGAEELERALAGEVVAQHHAAGTEDHREGVLAFLQKRPPTFRGR